MSTRMILHLSLGALAISTALLTAPSPAGSSEVEASTSATITPSLHPNRLGARSALTLTIHYTGGALGVPVPVRRSILRFPAGLTLELSALHTCDPARLRTRGPSGCPAGSWLGAGHATAEVRAGSLTLTEPVTLTAFLGPPHDLQPSVEILAQGYTPFDERVLLSGRPLPAAAPYGEELAMVLPSIPTLPLEPPASIVTLSLTIGARAPGRGGEGSVLIPSRCPAGGFPFAAEFTYADGSRGSTNDTAPCPA
jgi:hypothetical protein